jgi:hypothetical protein
VPGAKLVFYLTGTSTKSPAYATSALTTQLTNPVIANGAGHVPPIYIDDTILYRLVIQDSHGTVLDDIDPYRPGITTLGITLTSATGQSVNSVGALAALSSPVNDQVAFLTAAGREGMFVFSTANLSTQVTNDPGQGIYVAPSSATSGASGAWVRRYSGPLNVKWFGAVGDLVMAANGLSVTSNGTDDKTAIQRAINYASYVGGAQIWFPLGNYRCASSLSLSGLHNIALVGGAGSGNGYSLNPPAQLVYTGTGSTRFIDGRSSFGLTFRDLGIRYSSASFTGMLMDFEHSTGNDAGWLLIERCLIWGISVSTANRLINLNSAILCSVVDCHLAWGEIGIGGVAAGVGGYSNAINVSRCTFANLTVSAITNAQEGWTVESCWFEGTNGGTGGMPRAYWDDRTAGEITTGLAWHNNWHGDAVNVTDAWFCNNDAPMRGLSIQGGLFSNGFGLGIKLTAVVQGGMISGAAVGTIDLGSVAHSALVICGNFMTADIVNISASCHDFWAFANYNTSFPTGATTVRIDNPVELSLGNGTASGIFAPLKGVSEVDVNGTKVVGPRQTTTWGPATDLASVINLANDLQVMLRAHGLVS